ncbi:MAG: hypothetical protein U1F67_13345 [Rubrivivax sp.]
MSDNYIARHWRGELTLPVSYWVNNVLLAMPVGFAIGALAAWIEVTGDHLRGGSLALLVGWPLLALFSLWCIVGAWRSASAYRACGGPTAWAALAKLSLALSAAGTLWSTAFDFAPHIGEYMRMARGIDPIGNVQATLSPDGRRLRLEGPLSLGDAERVRTLAAGATALRIVELDSPGGRLIEGERIAALVRKGAWHTRTTGGCESACTLIHMAGERKQLLPGAKLGFHRARPGPPTRSSTTSPTASWCASTAKRACPSASSSARWPLRRTASGTPAATSWSAPGSSASPSGRWTSSCPTARAPPPRNTPMR